MRSIRCVVVMTALLLAAGCRTTLPPLRAVDPPELAPIGKKVPLPDDPRRQFDFWIGEWDVRNLQIDGDEWAHVGDARARIWSVANGGAVLEQWNGELGGSPLIGFSLRAWDPQLEVWSIWLNWHGGEPDGFSEMHGTRRGERIEQFPPGNTEAIRYSFSEAHQGSCRWDQAQSRDHGETWVSNWIMQFTRSAAPSSVDASNAPIVRPPETPARYEKTRRLDHLIGSWSTPAAGIDATVTIRVTSMLEGYGLLQFVDIEAADGTVEHSMMALGWDKTAKGWVALRVDDGPAGIRKLLLEPGSRSEDVTFSSTDAPWIRERWRCEGERRCRWSRERSDDGISWMTDIDATFE